MGTKLSFAAYIQLLSIRFTTTTYTQLSNIEHTSAVYTIFANYTQSLIGLAHLVYNFLSISNPPVVIITINIGYGKKLIDLAKIYINKIKYSGQNNSFTFQLVIFPNICIRADILSKVKIKVVSIILKSLILDYYYLNININSIAINFNWVYYSIRIKLSIK